MAFAFWMHAISLKFECLGTHQYKIHTNGSGISPVVLISAMQWTPVTEPSERQLSDSVVERGMIEAAGGLPGKRITFVGLQATNTDVLVRVKLEDGTVNTMLVRPSQP